MQLEICFVLGLRYKNLNQALKLKLTYYVHILTPLFEVLRVGSFKFEFIRLAFCLVL